MTAIEVLLLVVAFSAWIPFALYVIATTKKKTHSHPVKLISDLGHRPGERAIKHSFLAWGEHNGFFPDDLEVFYEPRTSEDYERWLAGHRRRTDYIREEGFKSQSRRY